MPNFNENCMEEIDILYAEAKARGYVSEVSFLVDKKLKMEDYVEVWPGVGWYRLKGLRVVK